MKFKVDNCRDGGYELRIDNLSFSGFLLRRISPDELKNLRDQIDEKLKEGE